MIEECRVCDKKAKKKKLGLPVYNPSYLCTEYTCICEQCISRLPYDLQTIIIRKAQAETISPKFSLMVINALKNTGRQYKLNRGWALLFSGKNGYDLKEVNLKKLQYFKKIPDKRKTLAEIDNCFGNKVHIHSVYKDGKLIKNEEIEKMLVK
jgi:hypothetical protein